MWTKRNADSRDMEEHDEEAGDNAGIIEPGHTRNEYKRDPSPTMLAERCLECQ